MGWEISSTRPPICIASWLCRTALSSRCRIRRALATHSHTSRMRSASHPTDTFMPPPNRGWATRSTAPRWIRLLPGLSAEHAPVAQALLPAASRLFSTLGGRTACRHKCRHGRHECLRHASPNAQRPNSGGLELGLCLIQGLLVAKWADHYVHASGDANQSCGKALVEQLADQSLRRRAAIADYLPEAPRIGPLAGEPTGGLRRRRRLVPKVLRWWRRGRWRGWCHGRERRRRGVHIQVPRWGLRRLRRGWLLFARVQRFLYPIVGLSHQLPHPIVGLCNQRSDLGRVIHNSSLGAQKQIRVGHGVGIAGIESDGPVGHAETLFNDRQVLVAQAFAHRGIGKLPLPILRASRLASLLDSWVDVAPIHKPNQVAGVLVQRVGLNQL